MQLLAFIAIIGMAFVSFAAAADTWKSFKNGEERGAAFFLLLAYLGVGASCVFILLVGLGRVLDSA